MAETSGEARIKLSLSPQAEKYARREAPVEARRMAARGALPGPGRILSYALPTDAPTAEEFQALISRTGGVRDGERLYHSWCARCHGAGGVSSSAIPDLRASVRKLGEGFVAIAQHGLPGTGMPSMADSVSEDDARLIRSFLESL